MEPNLAQPAQSFPQTEKQSAKVFWAYFMAIVLAITLGIAGYFIGFEQGSSKQSSAVPKITLSSSKSTLPAGLQKAQDAIKTNSGLLTLTQITQNYSGKLTSFIPEKSWTLENKGKTVTITNEANSPIKYTIKLISGTKITYQSAAAAPFKIGDNVLISTSFKLPENKVNVNTIVLIPTQSVIPAVSSSPAIEK